MPPPFLLSGLPALKGDDNVAPNQVPRNVTVCPPSTTTVVPVM